MFLKMLVDMTALTTKYKVIICMKIKVNVSNDI